MENKLEQVGFADPSKPVYCEYCLKGITGKYYIFKQHFYHPEHYLCPGCKNPLEEGLKFSMKRVNRIVMNVSVI